MFQLCFFHLKSLNSLQGDENKEDTVTNLQNTVHELSETVTQLLGEIHTLKVRVDDLETAADQTPVLADSQNGSVAFSAYLYIIGNGDYTIGSGMTLIFNAVEYNEGGYYNTENGVFTAPTNGVYFFYSSVFMSNNDETELAIFKNADYIGQVSGGNTAEGHANGVNAVVTKCNAGDTVYVRSFAPSKIQHHPFGRTRANTFSGFLLHPVM